MYLQVLSLMSDMKDSRDQLESVTTGGQCPGKRDSEGEKPATWGTTISEVLENIIAMCFLLSFSAQKLDAGAAWVSGVISQGAEKGENLLNKVD